MKKIIILFAGILVVGVLVTGCGKQNPAAPVTNQSNATKTVKLFRPGGVLYAGVFGGWSGIKPWYWTDAKDYPGFNATIVTNGNAQSANITRVNGSTWGKVSTFAIAYGNTANANVECVFLYPHIPPVWRGSSWFKNRVVPGATGHCKRVQETLGTRNMT